MGATVIWVLSVLLFTPTLWQWSFLIDQMLCVCELVYVNVHQMDSAIDKSYALIAFAVWQNNNGSNNNKKIQ